jgi:hypothetical protein
MRQTKPLFNCVGVVHSFRHAYTYYTRTYNVMALFPASKLYACFVLIPRRVQVCTKRDVVYIYTYSAKRLTQFRDVSPSRSGFSASTLCAIPLTMLLKALLNKLSSANCAFERFQVKILHENINFISPFSEAARKFHFESIDYPQTFRALVCSLHGFKESL